MSNNYRITTLIDSLRVQRDLLAREIARLEQSLAAAPEGKVIVNNQRGKRRYYHKVGGTRFYIKDPSVVSALMQKEYDSKMLGIYSNQLRAIESAIQSIEGTSSAAEKLIKPSQQGIVRPRPLGESDVEWLKHYSTQRYYTKGFRQGDPEHYSLRGRRTRSKSEAEICNCLDDMGLYYRYEERVDLYGCVVHPDFTCYNSRTRKVYYWEHCGMVADQKYADDMVRRLNVYRENGIYPGENLILTFETLANPLNVKIIRDVISKYLL